LELLVLALIFMDMEPTVVTLLLTELQVMVVVAVAGVVDVHVLVLPDLPVGVAVAVASITHPMVVEEVRKVVMVALEGASLG
jgi:hypothetical protein